MGTPKVCLTDGSDVTPGFDELKPNGQQKDYIVLTPEERAKGFVRPVRFSYKHIGDKPKYPLRDLTPEENIRMNHHTDDPFIKFEKYPPGGAVHGRLWTKSRLENAGGCNQITTIVDSIAETYARDPHFYGSTFCCSCGYHFPVCEFVWVEDGEIVGS